MSGEKGCADTSDNVCALTPHTPRPVGANWRTPCAYLRLFKISANWRKWARIGAPAQILIKEHQIMNNTRPGKTQGGIVSSAHERPLLLAAGNLRKLDAFNQVELIALLASGRTQTEIGLAVGVPQSAVSVWLSNQRGELASQIAAARKAGGEACLDRGLRELEAVRGSESAAAVALARALDLHWSKRAGYFNRAEFHDKGELVSTQPNPQLTPPSFTICILPSPNREERVIEGEHGDGNII